MEPRADERAVTVLLREEAALAVESPAPSRTPGPTLLEEVLGATSSGATTSTTTQPTTVASLALFLSERSPWKAVCTWFGLNENSVALPSREAAGRLLNRDIARIDALIDRQLNTVIHHPAYQKLEASWRGLEYLTNTIPEGGEGVKVRVLNVSWNDLVNDVTRALEFDQSQLFKKVYENEFGQPGGEPFGVLLGDYEMHPRPSAGHPQDDVEALSQISGVAAAAFAPFITSVHPSFFGLDSFMELERPLELTRTFEQPEYSKWRSLRQSEDSRFVGLTLPRILMRVPHGTTGAPGAGSRFREDVGGPGRDRYLWGNAAYAFGAVLIRSFANSGWLADIRGIRHSPVDRAGKRTCLDDGGLVTGLPIHSFGTDRTGVATRCSTEVIVTDAREKDLEELGFIPLCHCQDTDFSAFYGNQSIQKPAKYDELKATVNARLSAMLQYILCVSRFAHYVKVMARDRIGSMIRPEDIEAQLQKWLLDYTISNESAGPEVKAQYPLREARVKVRENPGSPGSYSCDIHLRPHFQLDQMYAAMKFTTELTPGRASS